MSSFTTPLVVEQIDDDNWELLEPFEYHVGNIGSGNVIRVPAGFETDFASIPKFMYWAYPKRGKYDKAVVIHDFLYRVQICSRRKADNIFLEGMKVLDVIWWRRWTIWLAVRAFGWYGWNFKHSRLDIRKNREKYLKDA